MYGLLMAISRFILKRLIDQKTKAIYLETIGNPGFNIPDFEAIAALAKKHDLPVVVDNTFGAAGYLIRPLNMVPMWWSNLQQNGLAVMELQLGVLL